MCPAAAAAQETARALPPEKEFIRGWIVLNVGLIDYGHSFYTREERAAQSKSAASTLGEFFETRWDRYVAMAHSANTLFQGEFGNSSKLADIAEQAHQINRELQAMPEEFPEVFATRPPIKSMKTREGLLYNYWRRPIEELYNKTAAAAHAFGTDQTSARGLNVLLTDFERDAVKPDGTLAKNGFEASLHSYFRAYVEIVETLRALDRGEHEVAQVYRAYGDLMQGISALVSAKYPAAKAPLREALLAQLDERYHQDGSPSIGHTPICFYSKWNPNEGKSELMEWLRALAEGLE